MFYFNGTTNTESKLSFDEFVNGIMRCGCGFTVDECRHLAQILEVDQEGNINFSGFIHKLRVSKTYIRSILILKIYCRFKSFYKFNIIGLLITVMLLMILEI